MLRKVLQVILCIYSLYSLPRPPGLSCTVRLTEPNCYMIESDCFFYSSLNQYLQNKVHKWLITNVNCCYCTDIQPHKIKSFTLSKVTQPLVGGKKKSLSRQAAKYL